MAILDLASAYQHIRRNDLSSFIGATESQWLDAKGGIYVLDNRTGRPELAKDIAALANAEGGIILVGMTTEAQNGTEIISAIKPVPQDKVNRQQHRQVVAEDVIPHVRGFDVGWIDCEEHKGVLYLYVPPQEPQDMPFVVRATQATEKDGVMVPIRVSDHTQWLTAANLQRVLSIGWSHREAGSGDESPAKQADRNTAKRLLDQVPLDALWVRFLQTDPLWRRVPCEVARSADAALDALQNELVRFLDPELAEGSAKFKAALENLHEGLNLLHAPMHEQMTYFEVPGEWKERDPERYYQTLRQLQQIGAETLKVSRDWVNLLNNKGLLH